ncbi:hypothetical protein N7489_007609 [Penicillium chrysogenum]|uniref:uncharacterized protein n=1 Tax=Penicillium chrysogenum TaxID=5076 RepID=UPI0024DF2294|nr:uncharacterized protein N7489_007609 [Penicillium chrysogenum]KAJ5237518.1 hypothetical protein N7489_007609 [Penicillium chrysogenum]KAJ6160150.1 hypothetical protein N7497_004687 [Penicillium chrysogenum]
MSEAKQHQDSLRLQRYSWSCAFLQGWQWAFHAISPLAQTSVGLSSDICGYCGQAFPKSGEPDSESRRVDHLASVHKCGECNETEIFDCSDDFRQHLIHRHSGSNGPWMKHLENACMKEKQDPDPAEPTKPQVPNENASREACGVSAKEIYRCMDDRSPRSQHSVNSRASQKSTHSTGSQVSDESIEAGRSASYGTDDRSPKSKHSVNSRASQESTHSTGSQVSDESIEAGHSLFHAMDDLIEGHLKDAFPRSRFILRKTTTPAKECYETGVRDLLYKIHKRYTLLYGERDENLLVLYDDMKLSFNGLLSRILVAQEVSEEAYVDRTLQVLEFGYRLDQCMGLESDQADIRCAASQEQDRTLPSQLAHDKSKYMGTKKHIKMLLSKNKSSKTRGVLSSVQKATGWWKSKTVVPKSLEHFTCNCCPKKPRKFKNHSDLRAHESEQLDCHLKNKAEVRRHENAVYLPLYSWSCAALISFQTAFGPSRDMCGYCGKVFTNYPQVDWDGRFEHLTTVHKFGECNNAKKFYRADHFRQHLKHSHAGTSGEWTNILESACMKEQQPKDGKTAVSSGASSGAIYST